MGGVGALGGWWWWWYNHFPPLTSPIPAPNQQPPFPDPEDDGDVLRMVGVYTKRIVHSP